MIHGSEVGRREVGERQAEVGEVALGVDQQHGHAGAQRLLDQHDAETGLARSGHADDHAVGRQTIGRRGSGCRRRWIGSLVRRRIDRSAEQEVSHATRVTRRVAADLAVVVRHYGSGVAFRGFPQDGIAFYEQLDADNSRAFWQANKPRYEASVKQPMVELTEALAEFGPFHLFRPHNDLRFSKNKPPYKTQQGAYGELEGGAGFYIQFSAAGLMAGAGYYAMATDQLARFRAAVDAEATGSEVADARRRRRQAWLLDRRDRRTEVGTARVLEGPPADRTAAPQGAHRRAGVRRAGRGCTATRCRSGSASRGPESSDLCGWLDAHVGPSTLPPMTDAFDRTLIARVDRVGGAKRWRRPA